jgi:hypothetical protein
VLFTIDDEKEDDMRIVLGVVCVVFGGIGWVGQIISGINYPLAQRLCLQEKSEGTDPLFRRAEANAARWDSLVLWTLVAAGILMLINNSWWPHLSLIAGGIYLDGAGREAAKCVSLSKYGVRIGTGKDVKVAAMFFVAMAFIALWTIIYSIWSLVGRGG